MALHICCVSVQPGERLAQRSSAPLMSRARFPGRVSGVLSSRWPASRCPVGHGWLSQDRVARPIRAASGRRSSFQKWKQHTTVFLPHQERPSHASKSFSQASRQEKYSLLLRQKAIRCVLVLISKTLIKSLEQGQSAPDEEPVRVELVDTARYSVG